jgi:hypothetical protein
VQAKNEARKCEVLFVFLNAASQLAVAVAVAAAGCGNRQPPDCHPTAFSYVLLI